MKDTQKPDHISLNSLIARLKERRFVIPDFQREFEWKPWDVRDLMRSIFLDYYIGSFVNKATWPHFEPRFKNKDSLATNFDQLAEIRNGIRDSHQLGEIAQKEGETALPWFGQVL